ncbi:MAG: hypothetical protein ACRDTM_12340 [Micromonosporaceae bacterium]
MNEVALDELRAAVERLLRQVMHWTPSRWGAASRVSGVSRAQLVHGLVQRLADLGADAERAPRRAVPRLDNDLALPDQLTVVALDLLRTAPTPSQLAAAHTAVADTHSNLTPILD